jgi:methionine-rich copper-binding protein CopC
MIEGGFTMSALRIAGLVAVAAAVGALGVTAPASAHADLKSTAPASGATLTSAPTDVVLVFLDPLANDTTITVTGPNGTDATAGMTQVTGATATVALRQPLSDGLYTVAYSAVAADGHPTIGAIEFTLAAPGPGDGGTAAPGGWNGWLLLFPARRTGWMRAARTAARPSRHRWRGRGSRAWPS